MTIELLKRKEAWKAIFIFLVLLAIFSSIWYYAILKLNPTSIYVGALMLSPALAALITLRIKRRPVVKSSMEFKGFEISSIVLSDSCIIYHIGLCSNMDAWVWKYIKREYYY